MVNYFNLTWNLLQKSMYGGGAWNTSSERSGEYYLHQFLHNQPDLNLRSPQVKEKLNVRSRIFHQGVMSSLMVCIVRVILKLKLRRVSVCFSGSFDPLVKQVGGWVLHQEQCLSFYGLWPTGWTESPKCRRRCMYHCFVLEVNNYIYNIQLQNFYTVLVLFIFNYFLFNYFRNTVTTTIFTQRIFQKSMTCSQDGAQQLMHIRIITGRIIRIYINHLETL